MTSKQKENYVSGQNIATIPQNSVSEGFQNPRHIANPFQAERNSAVTTAPSNSYHYINKKDQNKQYPYDRILKTGISVPHELQQRFYDLPPKKHLLSPNQFPINTFCPKRKVHKKKLQEKSNGALTDEKTVDFPIQTFYTETAKQESVKKNNAETSILEVIDLLFSRLNWDSTGILQGEIPESKETQVKTKDDGKFVYCVSNINLLLNLRYNPYNLVKIHPKKIPTYTTYYTVSASFISKICSKEGTMVIPTLEWLKERRKFYKIYNIPIFKHFRMWKAFVLWKCVLRKEKNIESSENVAELLFQADISFQNSLIDVHSQCLSMVTVSSNNYMLLVDFQPLHTYSLESFYEAQFKQCKSIERRLEEFRRDLIIHLNDVCEDFYNQKYEDISKHIKNIETNELKKTVRKKLSNNTNKSFRLIKDKYGITESKPPKDTADIFSETETKPLKYIKISQLKEVHKRMYRFIRLIDFIVMEMLRTLVKTAVDILQKQIEASFNCNAQPYIEGIGPKLHSLMETREAQKTTVPLFETSLLLENNNEEQFTSVVKSRSVLQPSYQDFTDILKSIINQFESVSSSFKSLLKEETLKRFTEIPDISRNHQEEPSSSSDETERECCWPSCKLLFDEDKRYQDRLDDIFENVKNAMKSVDTYIKQYDLFCNMISAAKYSDIEDSLQKEWSVDHFANVLQQFSEQGIPNLENDLFQKYQNNQMSTMESMPVSQRIRLFIFKADKFKQSCIPFPRDIIILVNKHLSIIANRKNEALLKTIRNAERSLGDKTKTVEEFVDHLTFLSRIADDIPRLQKEFELISNLFAITVRHSSDLSDEEKALFKTLAPSFEQLKFLVMYCEAKKDEKIKKFSNDLHSIVDGFGKQLHQCANRIRNPDLLESDPSYDVLEAIAFLKEDLQELTDKAKNFVKYEDSFSSAMSARKKKQQPLLLMFQSKPTSKIVALQNDIADVEKDLMLRQLLWQSLNEWNYSYSKWKETPFLNLDVNILQKKVSRFVQTVDLMEKELPSNTLVPSLKKKITMFKCAMPIVSSLRNPALKDRHWIELTNLIGVQIKGDKNLMLEKLLELKMFEHQDKISEISSQASNEATLEQMLQRIKDYWKKTDFELLAHTTRDIAIITGIDDIMTALDDSMVTIENIRGSRFHIPLLDQVNELDRKMNLFLRTFEEWVLVQRHWLYLETVFSAQDVQRQLPQEAKSFSQVDKNWRDIMRRTMDRPNALAAATTAGLIDVLQGCKSTLEKIHHSLEDYLETKRLVFSRFYFLSNDELLDILANSKNVQCIQQYLSKCFANIKRLKFDLNERSPVQICGMISEENEYVELPQSLKARGQIEQWLLSVEASMRETMKAHLKKSIPTFSNEVFMEWVQNQCGQIALTTVEIQFTGQVDSALGARQENIDDNIEVIGNELRNNLERLSSVIRHDMTQDKRNVVVALIIIIVHQRDTLDSLLQAQVRTPDDFQWIRELRYHWDDKSNDCFVEQSIATFSYGYEYLGCTSRLVVTPLTDRCFLTLTGALHFHLGGAPTGPAGTGKSESVKDLAKAMGKQCIVFNCSEGIDFKVIGRLLSGLVQSGSWCCLDEFNRIDREVLSVIAQQMHVIRSAKMASSIRFMFEGRDIRLNPTCGIFITMNPEYAGRVELPDNLESLFRPVSMVIPDNTLITEIVLLSNGFSSASILSQKLVNVYELSKKQLSKQNHYDFGLRAIKAVLTMAGENNRASKSSEASKTLEQKILIKAIKDSIYPKLMADDLKLFHKLLEDVFPGYINVTTEPTKLEKSIGIALRELSLQRWPSQVQKVVQFHSILNVRHGVMLVGPTAGGKTTVRKLLRHALYVNEGTNKSADGAVYTYKDLRKSRIVSMVTINPKSLSLGELYGEFDANTAKWTDGILSYAVRNFISYNIESAADNEKEFKQSGIEISTAEELKAFQGERRFVKSKHQWIVFDGPVDPLWVENLNTMLDETKTLCLANGERISMLQSMKVIFEVDSLVNASPATISRCGMVYLDPVDLGWQPTVKSWLNKLRSLKIEEGDRNFLWNLFEKTVEPGITFLSEHKEDCFIDVPVLSIIQTLCGFLDAFLNYINSNGGFYAEEKTEESTEKSTEEGNTLLFDFSSLVANYPASASKRRKSFMIQDEKNRQLFLCKLFVMSYTWAFGGNFNCVDEETEDIDNYYHVPTFSTTDIRHLFDTFVRNLFEQNFDIRLPVGIHLIYSYYVDIEKGQFMLWDHLVLNATIRAENAIKSTTDKTTSHMNYMNTLVPTPSTICFSFLVSLLSLHGIPVMLAGSNGVGKTTLIQDVLRRLDEPGGSGINKNSILGSVFLSDSFKKMDGISLALQGFSPNKSVHEYNDKVLTSSVTFSAHTNTGKPKQALKSKLVKRGRNAFGTPHGEKVLLFIDDLTMPQADSFGTQPALEVVREFLNYDGFYATEELHWKNVHNVTLIASCGNQKDSIKQNIRLFQKFSTLCLPQPSAQALHHIFYTQLSRVVDGKEFTAEVVGLRSAIISTLLGIYHNLFLTLKTTPAKSHYMFNIRDISKVVSGLLQAHPSVIRTKDYFIELLIHETSRVFLDRLITSEDINVFHDILLDQIHDFLKTKWSKDRLFTNKGIFGDFIEVNALQEKRTYQCVRDKDKLQRIIAEYYERAKLSGQKVPDRIVLFPDLCQHIVSTARVLRQPTGHMLMIGMGGTGKKAVVQLACYMQFCDFFHPTVSKHYNISDFKEDIRKAMLRAGIHDTRVVFFINDRNIVQESFLELICNVINGSEIPAFFDNESRETIALELRPEVASNSIDDSLNSIFEFFKSRVKKNFHVVFATSPYGDMFHKRCRVYPGLVNNCTVDWHSKWSSSALYAVVETFLLDEVISSVNSEIFFNVLVFTHSYVESLCKKFHEELRRRYHVTPKSFLDFILLFKKIYKKKQEECKFGIDRLKNGLLKLEETNNLVVEMQEELMLLGPMLEQKKMATKELMEEIEKDQEQVNKVRAVVKKEQEITDGEAKKVESIALEAQRDLDDALPQLEAANAALDTLNKYDIGEIRSYTKPPLMVMTVLSAVCVTLNENPDWPTAKLLLADPGFLKKLINFNHNDVSEKIYNRLKKYTKRANFNPIAVGKISVACKSMCAWILALEHYTAVSQMVRPKQEKCKAVQEALIEAHAKLSAKEISLKKVEDQLHGLEERYEESVQQLNKIKTNKQLTLKRLERASLMIDILTSEKDRWSESIVQIEQESNCMLSQVFMLAANTSYMGAFPPIYRTMFRNTLLEKLKEAEIKIKKNFNVIESETNPVQVQVWLNSGLPHDNHSIENALFIQTSNHWPFIIDPQHQAFKWIKKKECGNVLKIVEASDKNLLQVLESSIRLGEVVIIQNATSMLDSSLEPILNKSILKRGNQSVLFLGDCEIEYSESFRLYILTSDGNPNLLPELCIKAIIINFIVSTEGITEQILSKIVEEENPELEQQRNEILETLVKEKSRLTELENLALNLLHKSHGNVLDDEELIQTLSNSRITAEEIKIRVLSSEKTQHELTEERRNYLPLAERGALLFFIAEDLSNVSSIYQFSLAWFLGMFCKYIRVPKIQKEIQGKRRPHSSKRRLSDARQFSCLNSTERRRLSLIFAMDPSQKSSFISTMLNIVTETFYRLVSYALFAEHQLLLSFYMTTRILIHQSHNSRHGNHGLKMASSVTTEEYSSLLEEMKFLKADSFKDKSRLQRKRSPTNTIEEEVKTSSLFTEKQLHGLDQLSNDLPNFNGIKNHIIIHKEFWEGFIESKQPFDYLQNNSILQDNEKEETYFDVGKLSKFQLLSLIKILRPDHFLDAVTSFVCCSLGVQYTVPSVFDLQHFYAESNCRTPLMFISSPGTDPTSHLLRFVTEVRGSTLHLDMISLGRSQSTKAANAIKLAFMQKGSWVFLQNCHLAISFMPKLEEIIRELADPDININPHFRLWLSSRPDPLLPVSILQASNKITVEPPPGVKRNLQNLFTVNGGVVSEELFEDYSLHDEWKKLLYSACFFHAVLQERRKFGSFGWNTPYKFITPDLEISILTLKDVIGRNQQIPWDALQTLTGEIIYGGRVTNQWDKRCLQILLKKFYCQELLTTDFSFFNTKDYVVPSEDISFVDFIATLEGLPSIDQPQLFGMHENVVYDYKKDEAFKLIENLKLMQPNNTLTAISSTVNDDFIVRRAEDILNNLPDAITIVLPKSFSRDSRNAQSARVSNANLIPEGKRSESNKETTAILLPLPLSDLTLKTSSLTTKTSALAPKTSALAPKTSALSPKTSALVPKTSALIPKTPALTPKTSALATAMEQERKRFDNLLSVVTSSLRLLCDAMKGNILFTETLEEVAKAIAHNRIPRLWQSHSYCSNKWLSCWVKNLRTRIDFVTRWMESIILSDATILPLPRSIWLPALFYPQGILTAVLQSYARKRHCSVDTLTFKFEVTDYKWGNDDITSDSEISPNSIAFRAGLPMDVGLTVFGLFLDGASWNSEEKSIQQCILGRRVCPLPEINFIPVEIDSLPINASCGIRFYECPLYQTSKRHEHNNSNFSDFITSLMLPTKRDSDDWVLSGVAALCQTDD